VFLYYIKGSSLLPVFSGLAKAKFLKQQKGGFKMKVSSKNLFIALIFVTGLVLLSACETGPVSKPGLYVNKENRFTVEYPANFYSRPPMYKNEVFFSIYSE
jgi:hypothetical protein